MVTIVSSWGAWNGDAECCEHCCEIQLSFISIYQSHSHWSKVDHRKEKTASSIQYGYRQYVYSLTIARAYRSPGDATPRSSGFRTSPITNLLLIANEPHLCRL